jgi:hypothetical protein
MKESPPAIFVVGLIAGGLYISIGRRTRGKQ